MRGKNTWSGGRFTLPLELDMVSDGIEEDLQNPLGQKAFWYRFSKDGTQIDPIYDVGDYDGGRLFLGPIEVKVIHASVIAGQQYHNERGFYTVDTLRMVLNYSEVIKKLRGIITDPDAPLKDRIQFLDKLYDPFNLVPHTLLHGRVVTVLVLGSEVKPEEKVNDIPFAWEVTQTPDGYEGTDAQHVENQPVPREDYPTPTTFPVETPAYDTYETP